MLSGLHPFWSLVLFQAHLVVGRIQFLVVVGLRPSVPCDMAPSIGSLYHHCLLFKASMRISLQSAKMESYMT